MIQLLGAGAFAREVAAYIRALGNTESKLVDTTVDAVEDISSLIAIGSPSVRRRLAEEYEVDYKIVNFGKAYGEVRVKEGVIICPGTQITTNVTLGKHVIVNLNCTIGHDVTIGDYCTLNPGVNVSGNVTIGNNCTIGSNAVIREGITICDDVTVGAGMIIVKDITEPGTYVLDAKPRKL